MLILIEGMDNTGKTTLANRLLSELPSFSYYHNIKPKSHDEAVESFRDIINTSRVKDILCDRICAFSEAVYGPILRGGSVLSQDELTHMLDVIDDTAIAVIFCRPPIENVIRTIEQRDQMEGVNSHCRELYQAYEDYFYKMYYDDGYLIYDYTDSEEAEEIIQFVLEKARKIIQGAN